MPAGPHVPSINYIREALEKVPDAIRYDDPSTESRGSGTNPAIAVWISKPDRQESSAIVNDTDSEDGPGIESRFEPEGDEPAVAFEIPPKLTEGDIRRALGDELVKIEQLAQLTGGDAYGWYTTFHQKRYQYGVHIPFLGILAFAVRAFAGMEHPLERKVDWAFHAILRHELFHFNVDCMIANWELTTGAAVFWNAKERNRNTHGYVSLEEALANAYMLRGFKQPSRRLANSAGAYQALKQFCLWQPEGYSDAHKYVKTRGPYGRMDSYFDACSELSVRYQQSSEPLWRPLESALDTLIFYPDLVRVDWTRCPIIILDEHGLQEALGIGISYYQSIKGIEETERFIRSLEKLDMSIQKRWKKSKEKLALSTSLNSLDFKQWKKEGADYFSVRVGGNYRAHLRRSDLADKWFAEAIGNHKEMKHG